MGAFGVKRQTKQKIIQKRNFFRREGAIARAIARLYHISGTATPIELKFSGIFKTPNKKRKYEKSASLEFFHDFMMFFYGFGILA